ncbi:tyrosine-type recombinase/integrase [Vibrio harveyi]|uniref:tyrosine-type recombinase/integrase n=1 Tax=Vibrio harveyi TaxID=669 RepID=UPI003AF32528
MKSVQTEEIYDDFRLIDVEIDTLSKVVFTKQINNKTGEIAYTPHYSPSHLKNSFKKTKIIIAPNGSVVYPQSLYLVSKLRGEGKVKDTSSIAKALLLFTRFLDSTGDEQKDQNGYITPPEHLTYKSLTKYEEEGAPWRFAQYLIDNCRHRNSDGDEALALSTARGYMGSVLGFYQWLQKYGYIKNDSSHVVTHTDVNRRRNGRDDHDMLAHAKTDKCTYINSSNLMKMFPRIASTPSHRKLKPMTITHQVLFHKHLECLPKPFPLMFRLMEKTGLRIDELSHFPAYQIGDIDTSGLDVVPIRITKTKFGKPRTIEIPIDVYEELEIYKFSERRMHNALKKTESKTLGSELHMTDYLFLSNRGDVYDDNTLEKHFSDLRKYLKSIDPTWDYRPHDLRSTFATNWLRKEAENHKVSYEYLMGDLALLMGHFDTSVTEKYVSFMNEEASQQSAAKRKNNKINGGW